MKELDKLPDCLIDRNKILSLEEAKDLYNTNNKCKEIALRFYTEEELNPKVVNEIDYESILNDIRRAMRTYLVQLNVPSPPSKCTQKVYDQWATLVDLKLICAYYNQRAYTNSNDRYRIIYDTRSESFISVLCSNIADRRILNDTLFVFKRDADNAIKLLNTRLKNLING